MGGKFIFLEEDNDEFYIFVLLGVEEEVPPTPPTGISRKIKRVRYVDEEIRIEIPKINMVTEDEVSSEFFKLSISSLYEKLLEHEKINIPSNPFYGISIVKKPLIADYIVHKNKFKSIKVMRDEIYEQIILRPIIIQRYKRFNPIDVYLKNILIASNLEFSVINFSKLNIYKSKLRKLYEYLRLLELFDKINDS